MIDFVVISLAIWRLSSLLTSEEGPYAIFERYRNFLGIYYTPDGKLITPRGNFAKGYACLWCQTIWWGCIASALYYLLGESIVWIALPLALSALAIIVDKNT